MGYNSEGENWPLVFFRYVLSTDKLNASHYTSQYVLLKTFLTQQHRGVGYLKA